ncbi:MAG: DEAD/DEAH box helicase [Planctomycetota bacterium]
MSDSHRAPSPRKSKPAAAKRGKAKPTGRPRKPGPGKPSGAAKAAGSKPAGSKPTRAKPTAATPAGASKPAKPKKAKRPGTPPPRVVSTGAKNATGRKPASVKAPQPASSPAPTKPTEQQAAEPLVTPTTATPFAQLGLNEPLERAVAEAGYELATPIQAAAIPTILEGRDLIGCAQTGTGKTAAFTLPMLDRLLTEPAPKAPRPPRQDAADKRGPKQHKGKNPNPRALRALVLAPTRELAAQIGDSLAKYGRFTPLRHAVIFGGVSQYHQVKALRHGVDTLVATPGRLLDLMGQGIIRLDQVKLLVLDEADQMLDMGFLPDLRRIVDAVPAVRQTLMFSATMPPTIRKLASEWLADPESVNVTPVAKPADKIAQSVHFVDKKAKPDLLVHFLKNTPRGRTLVFTRTKHGADKVVRKLNKKRIDAAAIHGNKSQGARNRALAAFKGRNPPVLVATDIAARGLDIRGVTHVVNFDLPEVPESYVHRIGRTARAGEEGVAVAFCAGDERGLLRDIERLTKQSIRVEPTVDGFTPTDPIEDAPKKKGRGGRSGGNRSGGNRSAGGPKRSGGPSKGARSGGGRSTGGKSGGYAKAGSKPGAKSKPRRVKGSTAPAEPRGKREKSSTKGKRTNRL